MSSIKSGFITDLMVPPEGTAGKSSSQLEKMSIQVAMDILHDFEAYIRSSPLVTDVQPLPPSNPKYIDIPAYCQEFGIEVSPSYATGDWIQYEITDKLNVLFGWSTELVYYTAMRKTVSGFESVTSPGHGVKNPGRF